MTHVLTGAQTAGVLAVVVALFGLLPLWWAVLTAGLLAVVLATAAERIVLGRPTRPSGRRSGPEGSGVG